MSWQCQLSIIIIILLYYFLALGDATKQQDEAKQADEAKRSDSDQDDAAQFFTQIYKRSLKQMVAMRNASIEPCTDFYAHACGNFAAATTGADDAVPPFLYNMQDRLEFFEANYRKFETVPGKLLAQLYAECKARGAVEAADYWPPLVQQLPFLAAQEDSLQDWPFLRHQWQRRQLDAELNWIQLAAQLAAHGLPTLLHIYFAEETIYVAPITDQPCPTLRVFQRSMAPVLTRRHAQVAHIVAHEMRVLCRGLRGELPLSSSLTEPEATTETPTPPSLGQEQLELDDNTMDYFQSFFGLLNFTEEQLAKARKLPVNVRRIKQAWQVLRHTEPRIVYNYVLWSAHYRVNYEDCFELAGEFERLLHAELWQWHVLDSQLSRDVALAMYQLHSTRFQQQRRTQLGRRDWYGHLVPASVERRELQVARLLQTHAQRYLNLSELSMHYGQVTFSPGHFYGNLFELRRAKLQLSFSSAYVDEEDENLSAHFLRHFLHFVIITLHRPMYHYYATEGLRLWAQSKLLQDIDGYYTALDCLERQTLQLYDARLTSIYRPLATHEVEGIFHLYRSIQAALRDYYFWLQGESFVFAEQFVLQHFGLNEQKVIFYAVGQQMCQRQPEIFSTQVNRIYMNLPEFQAAFKCDAEAPMNPPAKCMVSRCD